MADIPIIGGRSPHSRADQTPSHPLAELDLWALPSMIGHGTHDSGERCTGGLQPVAVTAGGFAG